MLSGGVTGGHKCRSGDVSGREELNGVDGYGQGVNCCPVEARALFPVRGFWRGQSGAWSLEFGGRHLQDAALEFLGRHFRTRRMD